MEEPVGPDPWSNIANDPLAAIHRPTSAPPAMELNASDLPHTAYSGLEPGYFAVHGDASGSRDGQLYADSGAYLVRAPFSFFLLLFAHLGLL